MTAKTYKITRTMWNQLLTALLEDFFNTSRGLGVAPIIDARTTRSLVLRGLVEISAYAPGDHRKEGVRITDRGRAFLADNGLVFRVDPDDSEKALEIMRRFFDDCNAHHAEEQWKKAGGDLTLTVDRY